MSNSRKQRATRVVIFSNVHNSRVGTVKESRSHKHEVVTGRPAVLSIRTCAKLAYWVKRKNCTGSKFLFRKAKADSSRRPHAIGFEVHSENQSDVHRRHSDYCITSLGSTQRPADVCTHQKAYFFKLLYSYVRRIRKYHSVYVKSLNEK